MIASLNPDDLRALSLEKLIERMDAILRHSNQERNGCIHPWHEIALVSALMSTKHVIALSDTARAEEPDASQRPRNPCNTVRITAELAIVIGSFDGFTIRKVACSHA
jgi:hypothetical protein